MTLPPPGAANLSFEEGRAGEAPPGWFIPAPLREAGYSAEFRTEGCRTGRGCAVVRGAPNPPAGLFGNVMQSFPAAAYRGQTVRFRAWVRVEASEPQDRAQLWLRVDRSGGGMGFFDNMGDRPIVAAEWKQYEISGAINDDAETLNFGVMLFGKGSAWIDDVTLETDAPKLVDQSVREELLRLYARIDAAHESAAFDQLAALALPDATTGPRMLKMPLRAALEEKKTQARRGTKFSSRTVLRSIQVSGPDAIAVVDSELRYFAPGADRTYRSEFRDTWRRTDEGWKLKDSTPVTMRAVAPPTDAGMARRVAADLKKYAAPLATVEAGHALDDLAPFGRAVADARIVSLGEATHGTREFFRMKHRLLEYLVREKGFTVFAMEANWPESLAVDRYIKTGEGDPKAALAGMYFWTWNTQEVLDMIEWMRAWNRDSGARPLLTFTSFDMQTPDVAAERALAYLKQAAPEHVAAAGEAFAEVRKLAASREQLFSGAGAREAAERAAAVVALFDSRRDALVKASSPPAWRDARQAAEIVRQAAAMRDVARGPGYRDEMMARNVEWLAREAHPGEKIVLWAHNAHVRVGLEQGIKSMGAHLRERFGSRMYVAGFAWRGGQVRAIGMLGGEFSGGLNIWTVPPSPDGTGDAVLSAAGVPLFFLDFGSVPQSSALARWLADLHLFGGAGAVWVRDHPESNLHSEVLGKAYDGLIFVEEGRAAHGLPMSGRP